MSVIDLPLPETVTVVARSEAAASFRYGASYDVGLGSVALLGVEVAHHPPLGPAVRLPRGVTLDAATEALVERAVLIDYLGLDEEEVSLASGARGYNS